MIKDERGERSERIISRLENYCFVDKFIHKTSTWLDSIVVMGF
jgi:hypothetical protein